ncbi:hypothetical protein MCP1_5610001 [Candidatus Terasakiella magnetica]|nr:hypothetical protein MCP1_5610001 [Candidatus Terasakiella magnetica]
MKDGTQTVEQNISYKSTGGFVSSKFPNSSYFTHSSEEVKAYFTTHLAKHDGKPIPKSPCVEE